jgi:hypothetical protein
MFEQITRRRLKDAKPCWISSVRGEIKRHDRKLQRRDSRAED